MNDQHVVSAQIVEVNMLLGLHKFRKLLLKQSKPAIVNPNLQHFSFYHSLLKTVPTLIKLSIFLDDRMEPSHAALVEREIRHDDENQDRG